MCELFGVSRQAFYQKKLYFEKDTINHLVLDFVRSERVHSPNIGGYKLYLMVKEHFQEDFIMGRDSFYRLLDQYNLKLRQKKRRVRTTDSNHNYRKYPNIIKEVFPFKSNQIWVSDITYIRTEQGFCYLSLITDLYSRKIISWVLAPRLKYIYTEQALRQAIEVSNTDLTGLIHHSERGFQYCYPSYIKILKDNGILISMTETTDPKDNAVAERVNGILKQEWLNQMEFKDIKEAEEVIREKIIYYNERRPHSSINYLTPNQAYYQEGELIRRWKRGKRRYYERKQAETKEVKEVKEVKKQNKTKKGG